MKPITAEGWIWYFDTIDHLCQRRMYFSLMASQGSQLCMWIPCHVDGKESTSPSVVLFERNTSAKPPPLWWPCPMATWCTWCPGTCPQTWHYCRQPTSDWNWSSCHFCTSPCIDSHQLLLPYHRSPQPPSSWTWCSCGALRTWWHFFSCNLWYPSLPCHK